MTVDPFPFLTLKKNVFFGFKNQVHSLEKIVFFFNFFADFQIADVFYTKLKNEWWEFFEIKKNNNKNQIFLKFLVKFSNV